MNHSEFLGASTETILGELANITQDLAARRRQLGFVRAEEKRNWQTSFLREFNASGNVSGSSRVADAETAPQTAERYELEGDIAAVEEERDFLRDLLRYAS